MRVAVAGGTGLVGRLTVEALARAGHDPVPLARATGVDLERGTGLEVLAGADAVIDVTNVAATSGARAEAFFSSVTTNLLAAERAAGVGHHVVLSIVNVDRVEGPGHYQGKRAQEHLVEHGPVPFTIQRTTQFFEFAELVLGWTTSDGLAVVPPLVLQPVAASDVAEVLVEIATGPPQGRVADLAGPDRHELVELVRRVVEVRGDPIEVVAGWSGGPFGTARAVDELLPGADARLAATDLARWLDRRADPRG